jgi:MerR family transcriptional regulator, copper efflux regulator
MENAVDVHPTLQLDEPTTSTPVSNRGALKLIGEVADRLGLSLRTIRHYDEVGLVVPSGRTAGGFRLYTDEDVERLALIKRMKPLGFSLDEMRDLLEIRDSLTNGTGSAEGARGASEAILGICADDG